MNAPTTGGQMGQPYTPVQPGDVLAGKYRVEKILGAGGMGIVVCAFHQQLEERVAIKFLLPEALGDPQAMGRFAREARAAVKIKSEHVARTIDVGVLENGAPYIVMEYLQGQDLAAYLQAHGPLPFAVAVDFILQACEAIAEAHSLGIVHRDLKPANLFLITRPDHTPAVKVLDFGISKISGLSGSSPDVRLTTTTAVMGSPLYMSPEQMASARNAGPRSDLWSLGVILHELLTGSAPFDAETMPELCVRILQTPPPPLRTLRPDAPPSLERVLMRCLEKDPNLRYANIAEFASDLAVHGSAAAKTSFERISRVLQVTPSMPNGAALDTPPAPAGRSAETVAGWGQTRPGKQKTTARTGVVVGMGIGIGIGVLGLLGGSVLVVRGLKTAPLARAEVSSPPAQPAVASDAGSAANADSERPVPSAAAPALATAAESPSASATAMSNGGKSARPPSGSGRGAAPVAATGVAMGVAGAGKGHTSMSPANGHTTAAQATPGAATPPAPATPAPPSPAGLLDDRR